MSGAQDVLTIDPVAMNVVNRIAPGSRLRGDHVYEGGLLVQGDLEGSVKVKGTLIVWQGASLRGRVRVQGDFYLFGQLGAAGADAQDTVLECLGMAYVAQTGVSSGTLLAQRLQLYDGADLQGPFKTLKRHDMLPVLSDIHDGSVPS